jgi:cytochrome c-type biogenesis protein CcmH/NrfG
MHQMKKIQFIVLASALAVGVVLMLLPRSVMRGKEAAQTETVHQDAEFLEQLEGVKKETPSEVLANVEFFEGKLKAAQGKAQVEWLDSLSRTWDRQMRPGIAAEYVLRKAELLNTAQAWKDAGVRYLGISRYFEGESQAGLNARAINCLEKARELDGKDADIRTQLGVAYVEGSAEPMKGITLLREVVAEDSTNVDAQLSLGLFSMKSGQYDKAVKRFRTVIQLRPDLPEMRLYLADALQMEGDSKGALAELNLLEKSTSDSMLIQEIQKRRSSINRN